MMDDAHPPETEYVVCATCGWALGGLKLAGDVFVHRDPTVCETVLASASGDLELLNRWRREARRPRRRARR